ncbi:ANM_HP_G0017800.mRNA.1.CDS.1 [Saccharomyces cerevisiae]|nr:ANM_HP_G0161270.mRNA.1.CDS.1 [Saccharomyces cerevisiae]CAI5205809.1 ANM_HP_G0259630.mRNA.1.CDS.1 [Saccharomyces cerevisiae]CAI5215040.1 ANM_HP_G0017800.mRNA.1.CDS.1 [Saccharomyces cerevisiae]CAI6898684.1 ANM_HP_G0161270.mRNA.1.CDS.1 [Saccharomyces cerevisiae]CAI7011604.1 ANM_HP_G0259630.mRNA.1.CDS.1 [Saccharomyces cerevisiae]
MDEKTIKKSILSSSNDEKIIYKSRIKKFQKNHKFYIILLVFIAILQFISIAFFTRGFLLSRHVLDNISSQNETSKLPPRFNKAVILVIDALRFDFAIPVNESHSNYNLNYHNNILSLYDSFASDKDASSLLLKFIADPPTTTLQRLKGLTTGSLPTFIDAGSNFDGTVIEEDNFLKQLHLANKTVKFAGDDTWMALFHPFLSNDSFPLESLNVWDLDTVDNGVMDYFHDHLQQDKEWDVMIGHMLGIDHVGHKYGPDHFTMREKQIQVDQFIDWILKSIDDDTLLVILGDHGMDHTGNHGGDSIDELESTLFLYSKKPDMWRLKETSNYNIDNLGHDYRSVRQIDLVSSLALLMGQPIPFNNLGWPIDEIARNDREWSQFVNSAISQLQLYKDTMQIHHGNDEILEPLAKNISNTPPTSDPEKFVKLGHKYQKVFLQTCEELWAKFDYYSIATGITLLATSLVLLISITKLIPSIVVNQMVPEFVPGIIIMVLVTNLCFHGIFYVYQQPSFVDQFWGTLLATAIGIIIGCYITIFDRYNFIWIAMRLGETLADYWSRIAVMFMIIHALLFTSNSFTIWEDRIVAFLLSTFGMLTLYEFVFLPKRQSTTALLTATISEKEGTTSGVNPSTANSNYLPLTRFARLLGGYHSAVLIIFTRLASMITICREEQGEYCIPTFNNQNNSSWWVLGLCFLMIFILPACITGYYNLTSSYQAAAPIWINVFLKGILGLNFVYWSLTSLENNSAVIAIPFLRDVTIFKFTLARIIAGFSLIASNVGWLMGPLCIKLNIHNTDVKSHEATILGYTNIYGSEFFLLVINVLMSILLFNKPLAQLSYFLMCNQLLSILEIIDLLKLKENIIGPIALGLLSYQHFFTTAHQATIPSVQWDIGFMLSEKITFPFTQIAIILNTFGPHILVSLSVALLTLWSQPPDVLKPQTLLGRIVSNCGILLIYNTILCLSSFIWVTHFRRHLMVWKIFCPRFIFASLSLIVTQLVVTFGTIAFASGRLIKHINDIFWK